MLKELNIHNFATIENLKVEFEKGLNVLTGETGAGKSIIIDALNLALGGRADSDTIRTGEQTATIEALFYFEDSQLQNLTQALGIEFREELIIKRTLTTNNKNRTHINNSNVTVGTLAQVGDRLVDIHGQHDHQTLLHPELHIDLLDAYGKLLAERKQFEDGYAHYKKAVSELEQLQASELDLLQRQDLLEFQMEEIDSANLSEDEEDSLEQEKSRLANAEKIQKAPEHALALLTDNEGSITVQLGTVKNQLERLETFDPLLKRKSDQGQNLFYEVEDLITGLQDYARSATFDPERLQEIENRLAEINGLKRKYGNAISSILKFRENIARELESLCSNQERMDVLKKELASQEKVLSVLAVGLAEKREKTAHDLGRKTEKELKDLNMNKAKLNVRFDYETGGFVTFREKRVKVNTWGIGSAEFLFSANPGEEPRPLAKIASGGELARVMLALKTILNKQDTIPVLVFDEVDTGVGGSVAEKIGIKLKTIAKKKQVFCITHLPQIAGIAETHFLITKQIDGNRTRTRIRQLVGEERVEEIARMSGGANITDTTREHAREMLKLA